MIRPFSPDSEDASPTSSMRSRLNLLLGDRRRTVAVLVLASILSGFTEAGMLAIFAEAAVALVSSAARVHLNVGPFHHIQPTIGTLFVIGGALAILRLVLQVPLTILPARIAADVQARLRRDLFHAFTRASWDVQSRDREGHLQEIVTSQVIQATGGALQATGLLTAAFTFLVLMISAMVLNAAAAGVVLGASVLLVGVLRPLRRMGVQQSRALSRAQMGYAGGVAEAVRVAEETQVFGVAAAQRSRMDRLVASARDLFFRTQMLARLIPSLYQSLLYLLLVGGLAAVHAVGTGNTASLGAVILLLLRAGTNGQLAQAFYQALQQSLPFIDRLQEAKLRYVESSPVTGQQSLPRVRTLAFEHVSFSYRPGRPVLSDISFEMAGGEAVGVIGPSGAGKSTLVQILLQLRAPGEGRYLVNDVPAQEFAREDWNRQVAYVPQEPRLVHASVADNIRYFRNIDDDEVERAARLARIHDDVMGWSSGYDTIVGPRADAVSGGQQQRICLARALAGRPEVLVLDEPTSALDPHSETLIQESLTALKHDLTLIIIAHRMSTLNMCDRVMVIVDGRLMAFDTKALLQRENSYYRSASTLAAGTDSQP